MLNYLHCICILDDGKFAVLQSFSPGYRGQPQNLFYQHERSSENSAEIYTVYNEVVYGDSLSERSSITRIYANPVIDKNVEDYISAAVYLENDPRYSVELDLIDGRGFTAEEIATGSKVVIISTDLNYWKAEDPYKVGDSVLINDIPYEVIGIDSYSSYITEQNVLNNQNFIIYFDGIQLTATRTLKSFFLLVQRVRDYLPEYPALQGRGNRERNLYRRRTCGAAKKSRHSQNNCKTNQLNKTMQERIASKVPEFPPI